MVSIHRPDFRQLIFDADQPHATPGQRFDCVFLDPLLLTPAAG
jgi:hypothetical protein